MASNRYSEDEFRMISEIQHFTFCRRQWALIHMEQQWSDNYLTTAGNIIHERVHSKNLADTRNGILTIRGLRVSSAMLGVAGECDAVEFISAEEGVRLNKRKGLWQPYPVEYKHGKQKINDCDRLQVAVQAMCLEEMFCFPVSVGYIFYCETRRREIVDITDELRENVKDILKEMHHYAKEGHTPKVKASKRCKTCSLNNICMPSLMELKESASNYIKRHLEDIDDEANA